MAQQPSPSTTRYHAVQSLVILVSVEVGFATDNVAVVVMAVVLAVRAVLPTVEDDAAVSVVMVVPGAVCFGFLQLNPLILLIYKPY